MKIAIPVWEKGISPVFDTASRLLIIEVKDQKEASRFEMALDEQDLARRCVRIRDMGVDILICGAISRPYSRMLIASGIIVIPELSGRAEDVLDAYLKGDLFNSSRFLMPGCKKHGFGQRRESLTCAKNRRLKKGG